MSLPRSAAYSITTALLITIGTATYLVQARLYSYGAAPLLVFIVALVALATLAPAWWNANRGEAGSATAWGYMAIPPVAVLILLTLPLLHLSAVAGRCSGTDPFVSCTPGPLGFWLAAALFLAAVIFGLKAAGKAKAGERSSTSRPLSEGTDPHR